MLHPLLTLTQYDIKTICGPVDMDLLNVKLFILT